jgi:hypothetical protein
LRYWLVLYSRGRSGGVLVWCGGGTKRTKKTKRGY